MKELGLPVVFAATSGYSYAFRLFLESGYEVFEVSAGVPDGARHGSEVQKENETSHYSQNHQHHRGESDGTWSLRWPRGNDVHSRS